MKQSTKEEPLSPEEAENALKVSKSFIQQRLIPDLKRAEKRKEVLQSDLENYSNLIKEIESLQDDSQDSQRLAPIGMGVHIPIQIKKEVKTCLVSMGLSNRSETDWSLKDEEEQDDELLKDHEAGIYAELTFEEATEFAKKKVEILKKKLKLVQDRTGLIQGHIEMVSRSIEQLENLQTNPTTNFIDLLST